MDRHRPPCRRLDRLRRALAHLHPFLDGPAERQIAVDRIVRRRLVGHGVGPDAAPDHLRQISRRIAEQADAGRLVGRRMISSASSMLVARRSR
jgi:hypothetical protein